MVKNKANGQIQLAVPAEETTENGESNLSFDSEMAECADRATKANAQPRIQRTVSVDMSTADISKMSITNKDELLAEYRAYEVLKKGTGQDNVTFTVSSNG